MFNIWCICDVLVGSKKFASNEFFAESAVQNNTGTFAQVIDSSESLPSFFFQIQALEPGLD